MTQKDTRDECGVRRSYTTMIQAERIADIVKSKTGHVMVAYSCSVCNGFHVRAPRKETK